MPKSLFIENRSYENTIQSKLACDMTNTRSFHELIAIKLPLLEANEPVSIVTGHNLGSSKFAQQPTKTFKNFYSVFRVRSNIWEAEQLA